MDKADIEILGNDKEYWWFKAKRELLESYVKPGDKVLNIGCGNHKPKGWTNWDGPGWEKKFKNDTYDIVIMGDVLEHIEEDFEALMLALSKAKPGGKLIMTVPAHQWLYGNHDKNLNHKRRYSKNWFLEFNSLETYYWNTWLSIPIAFYKYFNTSKSDFRRLPKLVNKMLYWILKLDNKRISFPWGLTIVAVYER